VDARVKRFHAPAEHLGDVGQLLDARDLDPALAQELGGSAARDELDVELLKPAREVLEARLVERRQ